jgi:hypothetical protein
MAERFGAVGSNISVGAGQSIRRNAGDTAFEAFTPEAAGAETDPIVGAISGIVKADGDGNISAAVADTDFQSVPSEGAFEDGDKSKLDGIEAGADVTDSANVASAGALMKAGGTMTGALVPADHGTATAAQVVGVCYGTSETPPTASGTPEGTLYIEYTA